MVVAAFFFYLFACICVASAVMVIASRNPVHSQHEAVQELPHEERFGGAVKPH